MNHYMKRNVRIWLMLATVVAVALLATFWATSGPVGTPLERQSWGRWDLTHEQRREIDQLIRDMMRERASWEEITAAVEAKLDEWNIRPPSLGDIELFYTVKAVLSTINATLLIFLLITYIDIYMTTKSEFTVGLIIFSMVLLLYALTTNPIVQWVFGFHAVGLGPFAMLPDLFTCAALAILLYLTVRY